MLKIRRGHSYKSNSRPWRKCLGEGGKGCKYSAHQKEEGGEQQCCKRGTEQGCSGSQGDAHPAPSPPGLIRLGLDQHPIKVTSPSSWLVALGAEQWPAAAQPWPHLCWLTAWLLGFHGWKVLELTGILVR